MKTVRKLEDILHDIEALVEEAHSLVNSSYEVDEKWIEQERRALADDRALRETEKL